ncbi:amidohydrolase family protein [Pseudonocardia sp. NPDC049154]|uniref:amidohydrolase family protein n=1 Tax=Pseudonocardia sp. NPDC049154 TaxID=3155501 RepID=UPI0033E3B399
MYTFFSVDDHIIEPANVWVNRVPEKYKDVVPHVVEVDGRQLWEWEGHRELTMGLNAVAGKPREEWGMEPARFEDMIPGCYQPEERRRDLLSNGIFASIAFPTLLGFGGRKVADFQDKDAALLTVQAWNDYMLDEWCAAAPEMFVPMHILPVWDVDLCVAEHERMMNKGSKAICFIEDPQLAGLPSYHEEYWHPLMASAQATDAPICMHIGSGGSNNSLSGITNPITEIAAVFTRAARASINMMMSDIPRKFPDIKLVWSEGGIGWIPAALERADDQYKKHSYWSHKASSPVLPSEIAQKNMWFCMIEEPKGLQWALQEFHAENILFESDYPHADTPFPRTQASAKVVFEGVAQETVDLIAHKNAEKLFNFPLSQELIEQYGTPNA